MVDKVAKSEEEWKKELGPNKYHILREKGTEPPFTGELYENHREGVYRCAGCGQELFGSDTKFESGSGWPSFYLPLSDDRIEKKTDRSLFTTRTEILCAKCGGHLGHVFNDGPRPTGLRYCVNSASLRFEEANKKKR